MVLAEDAGSVTRRCGFSEYAEQLLVMTYCTWMLGERRERNSRELKCNQWRKYLIFAADWQKKPLGGYKEILFAFGRTDTDLYRLALFIWYHRIIISLCLCMESETWSGFPRSCLLFWENEEMCKYQIVLSIWLIKNISAKWPVNTLTKTINKNVWITSKSDTNAN